MRLLYVQIRVDKPTSNGYIALPNANGTFAIAAETPLSIDANGTIHLDQHQINTVGNIAAGIARGFGE